MGRRSCHRMATYWTMRGEAGEPADKPPGTGSERETTEREEFPQNGNIQDEEGGGGPVAEPPDTLKGGGEEGQVEN